MRAARLTTLAVLAAALAGCGASRPSVPNPGDPAAARVRHGIQLATHATADQFPSARGKTLRELGRHIAGGPELAIGTSVLEPGSPRLAYGLIDRHGASLLGPSAVYIARGLDAPAHGPFPARADSLTVDPRDRSRQAVTDSDAQSFVYAAQPRHVRRGPLAVLAVVRQGAQLTGAATQLRAAPAPRIPAVGSRAPTVHTDTVQSAHGNLASIDTRTPHDDMHAVDLATVVGRRPVALLFATPSLCQSRLCGPVVDIAQSLERRYRAHVTFIHEEVYAGNDPNRGLRPSLHAYGLPSEPWLFTIDRHGRIAARVDGAFGYDTFERAVRTALG